MAITLKNLTDDRFVAVGRALKLREKGMELIFLLFAETGAQWISGYRHCPVL